MFEKIVILVFIAIMLIMHIYIVRSWSKPADIYFLWTIILIGLSVVWIYPTYSWKMTGILWWLSSCIFFQVGGLIGQKFSFGFKKRWEYSFGNIIPYRKILYAYFIIGILYSVILLATHGFSIRQIFNRADLFRINNYMQGYRYSNSDENEGIIQQICLAFTYGLPVCCGFVLADVKEKKDILLCFMGLIPNLLITILNNTKAGVILAVILFGTGFLIRYIENNKKAPNISMKAISIIIILFIMFMAFMYFAIRLRYNSDVARSSNNNIIRLLKAYIFGCTVNFDHYFVEKIKNWNNIRGTYLADSNIMTANMNWIHQYSYVGALFVWAFRGFLSGTTYKSLLRDESTIIGKIILVYCYVNALYFFTFIAYSYKTVIVGTCILFPFFLASYYTQTIGGRRTVYKC